MTCEPATQIVASLGGLSIVAEAANVSPMQVTRWCMPRAKGGTEGFIPRKYHSILMKLAAMKGYDLPVTAFVDPEAAKSALERAA